MIVRRWLVVLIGLVTLLACSPAPASPSPAPSGGANPAGPVQAQRTFIAAIRLEPITLISRSPRETFAGTTMQSRLFNADLAILNGQATPVPYMVEALPALNTES